MKTVAVLAVIAILIGIVLLFVLTGGPDISQLEHLKEPRISAMESQKMVVVQAKGDPNVIGSKAFGQLFKVYYGIKGTSKGLGQPAPRARWPVSADTPKTEWVGLYGMPVPQQTAQLPEHKAEAGFKVELTTWEYGDVAEILHIGPYDREEPATKRLADFIKEQGYEIAGDHEEEYLKGPGMFLKGNPGKYATIIRYRVKKTAEP